MALDPVRLTQTKTVASHGKVNCSESITTVVVLKLKIEKGQYTAISTFSIKTLNLFISCCCFAEVPKCKMHVLQVIVLHIRTYCSTMHSRCAHWTNYCRKFSRPHLKPSCENIVSRSQALFLPPPQPLQAVYVVSRS